MSANAFRQPTVWFVTGSQQLYGAEILAQVTDQSQQIVRLLDSGDEIVARVIWQPVVTDTASIRRLVLRANADEDCVGLIAWMHTFSPAKMWIAGLQVLDKPLLHLHTQLNESLPWSTIDMGFMNLNQSAHGDREFGFLLTRMGQARKTVFGHAGDPAVRRRLATWVRAALGFRTLRRLRVARFGDNMRDVAVTEGDKVDAELRFGCSVNTYGVNDLVAAVEDVAQDEITELVTQYDATYAMASELASGGSRRDSLREAARIELGLRAFLVGGGFGAFTTTFEDLGGLRQLPGIGVQRMMADGFGFGAEGDWKTAVMVATVKAMAQGTGGGTSFMEDYTYHLGPGEPKTLGAHMLEVCPSIAAGVPSCEVHPLDIGRRDDPVRLVFDAKSGPGVVVGLCYLGDRYRLVVNEVELVPPDRPLSALPVARAVWKAAPDLPTAAEAWLACGGPHHTVLTQGVGVEAMADLASMMDTELITIGANASVQDVVDRLRWNAASYLLARR